MSDTPRMDRARDYTAPEKMDREGCDLEREVAELRRKLEEQQWQPIETAPDGIRTILLCRGTSIFTGYYGGADSGWRYNARGSDSIWPPPTHWMPLPEPPEESAYEEKQAKTSKR